MRVVELSNSNNWESIYSTNIYAVSVPMQNGTSLISPIPEIVVPFVLDKFILAVSVDTDVPTNSVWRFAGYINQKISTGIVIGGGQDATAVNGRSLFLDRVNLILFQKISTSYAVSIRVPRWFPRAGVNVWQYTGVDDTSEEILLTQEFANINFKLDQLLNN
ncbi:hypothetical protein Nos7524_3100 [Nostoc sp. PCC 7524]|uniref:hypothetical protein n=1 Tax=Nostoc sp. (strain ATCC 29411 / PCC 7524) TaxID=28072 RepID=UPI00029F49B6|nr:hypothetical protein [Nostoc sp. PCC 7524]AFY48903.1 hypothetical protein Nos7524_3100 [Nostoc sp. PCC 7524]